MNHVAMAYICSFTRQSNTWNSASATWLLPVVASVVAAASGGVVASQLAPYDPQLALSVLIIAYVVWGTGVPVAMFIITLWITRTAIVGLPNPAALGSMFLPLGPCGQGSFGILIIEKTIRCLAYDHGTPFTVDDSASALRTADVAWGFGNIVGLALWGLGLCFYILAHAE
jgi:tellurite resistance protein TehA-like permease